MSFESRSRLTLLPDPS